VDILFYFGHIIARRSTFFVLPHHVPERIVEMSKEILSIGAPIMFVSVNQLLSFAGIQLRTVVQICL